MMNQIVQASKSATWWMLSITGVLVYVCVLLYVETYRAGVLEPFPEIADVSGQVKRLATKVDVGMHIKTFPSFSITAGEFVLDAIVWFRFTASTESFDTLARFSVQNSLHLNAHGLMHKSPPIVKLLGDKVLVAYNVQTKFNASLAYKMFPLGNHRLNIVLVNQTITPQELVFITKPEYVTMSNDIMVSDWNICGVHAHSGYQQAGLDRKDKRSTVEHPCVAFSLDFERIGFKSLFTLYFPLFMLFLLGLLSMMINVFDFARLGMIAASLPMLVLYRLVLDASAPKVAYATHIDFVFYMLVSLSLPILFLQMFVALEVQKMPKNISDNERHTIRVLLEDWNNRVFYITLIGLIVLMTYSVLR